MEREVLGCALKNAHIHKQVPFALNKLKDYLLSGLTVLLFFKPSLVLKMSYPYLCFRL